MPYPFNMKNNFLTRKAVIADSAARDLEVLHFSGHILKNYKYYKMCIFMKSK